jgi:ATP-dependent exoDNAse (exonuclease V) alpha subunit
MYNNKIIMMEFLPIKLAYSITIHSSQGMTIDFLSIDLGNTIFEYGQGYTGLSRARNLESIIITNLSKKSFKCHPKVLKFYKIYSKRTEENARHIIYNYLYRKIKCHKKLI